MSEKKGLLPIVNEEIGYSIQRDYARQSSYCADLVNRLQEDNPCVLRFIVQMSARSEDQKLVAETALLVYRLLESQAETNQLERMIDM